MKNFDFCKKIAIGKKRFLKIILIDRNQKFQILIC